MIDWFVNWFDSPYYHILYKHRDDAEAERLLNNLLNYLKPKQGATILDLACGRGRHAVYLNEQGYDVTGIDLSPSSIEFAAQYENEHLSFFQHDMRKPFRVNSFDYVFNLFTSFGYFEQEKDNLNALQAAVKSLKPNGILVLDYMNVHKVTANLVKHEVKVVEDIEFYINRRIEDGFIVKEIEFTDKKQRFQFKEEVQVITQEQFQQYFDKCSLKMLHLFGDYALNPFNVNSSDRLILVAQKTV